MRDKVPYVSTSGGSGGARLYLAAVMNPSGRYVPGPSMHFGPEDHGRAADTERPFSPELDLTPGDSFEARITPPRSGTFMYPRGVMARCLNRNRRCVSCGCM